MSKIDKYTPAFPIPNAYSPNGDVQYGCDGMSLRAYLAGQAVIAAERSGQGVGYVARRAVEIADALIAELNKPISQ